MAASRCVALHCCGLLVVALALTAQRVSASQILVRNATGQVAVPRCEPISVDVPVSALPECDGVTRHGFLIVDAIPTDTVRLLLTAAGVRLRSFYDSPAGGVVYLAEWCESTLRVRQRLRRLVSTFHNLIDETAADKVERETFLDEGHRPEVISGNGTVYARITSRAEYDTAESHRIIARLSDSVLYHSGRVFVVSAKPGNLLRLASMPEADEIAEVDPVPRLCLPLVRDLARVDSAQAFTVGSIPFPPGVGTQWAPSNRLTGEGVWVGLWDTGIDDGHLDFKEDSVRQDNTHVRVLRLAPGVGRTWRSDNQGHGTHVGGIIGGNGWMSDTTGGGGKYRYRGVAPKVRYYLGTTSPDDYAKDSGDVNNHSTPAGANYYSGWSRDIDASLSQHGRRSPPANIAVFAACNSGVQPGYYDESGYFSISSNTKDAIVVGGAERHTGERAAISSIGPTRDGRVGIDVVAPMAGGADAWTIEIPYMAIVGAGGAIKHRWDFNGTDEGVWQNMSNFTVTDSSVRFDDAQCCGYLSDTLMPSISSSVGDTLVLRYRAVDSIADADVWCKGMRREIRAYIMWQPATDPNRGERNPFNWQGGSGEAVLFYAEVNAGWCQVRLPLQRMLQMANYENESGAAVWAGKTMTKIAINFHTASVRAPSHGISTYQSVIPYIDGGGTSAAVPVVTGTIALMLQEYKQKYLDGMGRNIHDHAFWNSTAKALVVHTATDMVQPQPRPDEAPVVELGTDCFFHRGPDYATGYGLLNASKAIQFVDTAKFKEDSIGHRRVAVFRTTVANTDTFRATLAWDDDACTWTSASEAKQRKLVNDLRLQVAGSRHGAVDAWVLDTLKQGGTPTTLPPYPGIDSVTASDIHPAYRGQNHRDVLEVVDVDDAVAGDTLTITVHGDSVPSARGLQDYSIVADAPLWKDAPTGDLINAINFAAFGASIQATGGDYLFGTGASVPALSQNVNVYFTGYGAIRLAPDARLSLKQGGAFHNAEYMLSGEYYFVTSGSPQGAIYEIGGRASFSGTVPCGYIRATNDITLTNVAVGGCSHEFVADGSVVIGPGTTLGDGFFPVKVTSQ